MMTGGQGLGDAMPRETRMVRAVAAHERLTSSVATEKVASLLGESWGPPAIRQMIRDEIDTAVSESRWPDVDALLDTYQWCCLSLPFGTDRRDSAVPGGRRVAPRDIGRYA